MTIDKLKSELEIMSSWQGDITNPLVSICCITYNHEKYIEECLNGFLIQETDFPFEILIDDDFSQDNTAVIIREYQKKFPNIIKPRLKTSNVGAMNNFTQNLKRATGEYIALCEGDDYWIDSNKLQTQITEMKKLPEVKMSFHPSLRSMNNTLHQPRSQGYEKRIYSVQEVINLDFDFIHTNTLVFSRNIITDQILSFIATAQIGDFFIRVWCSTYMGALCIDKKPMGCYRVNSIGSWTNSVSKPEYFVQYVKRYIEDIQVFNKLLYFKFNNEFNLYIKKLINACLARKDILFSQNQELLDLYCKINNAPNKIKYRLMHHNIILYKLMKLATRIYLVISKAVRR